MSYNCQPCVRRKVKCDKAVPSCASCEKAKLECLYKAPQPPRKRKRRESEDVHQRLARYERVIQENGLLSTTEARSPSCQGTPGSVHDDGPARTAHSGAAKTGRLVSEDGKSRYIDSRVWLDVAEISTRELSDNEGDDQAAPMAMDLPIDDPLSATLLGMSNDLSSYHPPYPDAMKLWTIYVKNVDPLCKILHIPTTTEMIEMVSQQPTKATRAQECLVFAVYYFAVYSITDEDCIRRFEKTRTSLMSKYQYAMRQGLVNASWLKTTELQILQAYVLFLPFIGRTPTGGVALTAGTPVSHSEYLQYPFITFTPTAAATLILEFTLTLDTDTNLPITYDIQLDDGALASHRLVPQVEKPGKLPDGWQESVMDNIWTRRHSVDLSLPGLHKLRVRLQTENCVLCPRMRR